MMFLLAFCLIDSYVRNALLPTKHNVLDNLRTQDVLSCRVLTVGCSVGITMMFPTCLKKW